MGDKYLCTDAIHYHLSHSFNRKDDRYTAQFWFARSLYLRNEFSEAFSLFTELDQSHIDYQTKIKPRGQVWDGDQLKIYYGTICQSSMNYVFIRPDLAKGDIFAHSKQSSDFDSLYVTSRVQFNLAFSFRGPVAINVELEN